MTAPRRARTLARLAASALGLLAVALMVACGGRGAAGWAMDRVVGGRFDDVNSAETGAVAIALAGAQPPLLFDVRTAEEYAVSHLPGARHLPPDADLAQALRGISPERRVVVYCSVGWRSAEMAQRMRAAGFGLVTNMEGSIFRWVAEERPLVDDSGAPTTRVHPFGPPWSWLVAPEHRAEIAP